MAQADYQVLARKWRPQAFEGVVGQEHVTRTLKNAIEQGRIHHAYLFIGSRGIGKTTTARILAKALNCLAADGPTADPCGECANCISIARGNNIDVMEIDGASNNGVDDVREIRENIRMVPSNARYKIYIIDEVHQLSSGAFNALLKTLEEPPPHAVFVLATTEAHKIPATIISRCQRHDFRRVATPRLVDLLRNIVDKEGLKATDEALYAIARAAEGGVRDSESILDQLISYCDAEITFKDVIDVLGLVDWRLLHDLCDAILDQDIAKQLSIVEDVVAAGKDLSQFLQEILQYYRNLLVCKTAEAEKLLSLPEDELREMQARAQRFSLTQIIRLVEQFAELTKGFDWQIAQRIALESLLIRLSKVSTEMSVDAVLEKLLLLQQGGGLPPEPPANPKPAGPAQAAPAPRAPAPSEDLELPPVTAYEPPSGNGDAEPPAPRRIEVTMDNLRRVWPRLVDVLRKESLTAGVWFANGQPRSIEGSEVILHYARESAEGRSAIEQADSRRQVEAVLQRLTTNLTTFRTELDTSTSAAQPDAAELADPGQPWYPTVNPELARTVAEDRHIQEVLEVFRGRIADIRQDVSIAHPEE
ncbi:MAG: DNA polymerase III subunit gamma/tau [Candidatus Hydrogenedentes bacterium]|nr:DNA polymerase III subunit gamma/tau [Candidatus Hydrogenedentota bacterium]